ncbi:hypothetical protein BH11BAC3_BH11BAC3_21160 [soil metagenome]
MNRIKIIILSLAVVALSPVYISCTKDVPNVGVLDPGLRNGATVQVFNATVKSTRNYIYVDGVPVSGAALNYGAIFPATAFAFNVSAGSRSFLIKDTTPTTLQVPITFTQDMAAGKSYTIFTYDTITSVKQVTVTNNIVVPSDTTSRLRFGNFIYNTTAIPAVDVYSFRRGATPVFSNVASTTVTDFIPYAAGLTDTLYVYATGTTSPLLVKALVPSLVRTRSYTAACSGSYTGTKAIAIFATY